MGSEKQRMRTQVVLMRILSQVTIWSRDWSAVDEGYANRRSVRRKVDLASKLRRTDSLVDFGDCIME